MPFPELAIPSSLVNTRVAVDWKAIKADVRKRASALVWSMPLVRAALYSAIEAAM
jgi:hypothetical protein